MSALGWFGATGAQYTSAASIAFHSEALRAIGIMPPWMAAPRLAHSQALLHALAWENNAHHGAHTHFAGELQLAAMQFGEHFT